MNGVIVIVAYRPKPGKESETLDLVRSRVPTLHKEALVTERTPIIMRARDVLAMWNRFFAVCDCVPLNQLSESAEMFAGFEPIPD
jgi:hypothetical protein